MSQSDLCPWASPMGVIVPAWVGTAVAPWAGFGVATVPLLGASGRKRQEDGNNKKAPSQRHPRAPQQDGSWAAPDGWVDGHTNGK